MLKAILGLVLLGGAVTPALAQAAPAQAEADTVPARFLGVWGKQGRCDVVTDRLTITATTAAFGSEGARTVSYSAADKVLSFGEYDSDLIEMGGQPNILVNHTQGLHTAEGNDGYTKCGPQMQRETWPQK